MNKTKINNVKPSQQQLNTLLELYQAKRYVDAEKLSLFITKEFPEDQFAWNVLVAVLKLTGRINESLITIKKSIKINPNVSTAHNNLGVILMELDRLEEAQESFSKSILLKPDYAAAHNNLCIVLQKLGRINEAEASCMKAIKLKPDYAEAYNNLGTILREQGRLQETLSSYTKAIKLNPQLPELHQNLTDLLTSYAPQEDASNRFIKINHEIKKNYLKDRTPGIISDDKIIHLFCESSSIIKGHHLELKTDFSQVYRRNSIELNCKRHMTIFNKFNVIPKFCFGCYKVQVEPRSILELIKLVVVFDQIKLVENNTRKCMIEMRSEISGFYKGLIYCSSLDEAFQVANYLEIVVKENIRPGMPVVVKRGCSEYPISFPDYKAINKSGPQLMNYNEDWKSIEEDYDSLSSIKSNKIITPSLSGLNLQDVLIIRNWIDYAKGIGDSSVHLLNQNMVFSSKIYKEAKTRIEKNPR